MAAMFSQFPFSTFWSRAVVIACVAALAACGGGGDKKTDKTSTSKTTGAKVKVAGSNVTLKLTGIDIDSAGPAAQLDNPTRGAVMSQTRKYVEFATVKPLLTGKVQKSFNALFAPTVAAAAVTKDRGALTDDGVGKVSGDVHSPTAAVKFTALVDTNGNVLYVASNFGLNVASKIGNRPLRIKRIVELTFQKTNGKWLIAAYRVIATRNLGSGTTSSAATSTTRAP
jgi:hypothetical protein